MSDIVSQFKLVKGPIYSHCFSQDKTLLAITYDTDCYVYKILPSKNPHLIAVLPDHDKTVTAVDISVHGRIVTCSQDRNAIVWEPLSDGSYKPTLVLLRINRAATCVCWASSGYKFAVGSSARIIAVCYYEQENDWWVSKHIKKPIKSTINAISWHSNSVLLACGGTDGYARLFSGFVKGLDSKEQVAGSPWADKFPFGSLIREWYEGAWIHDIKWRSNIDKIAFVSHDGALNVVDYTESYLSVENPEGLPFNSLCWINDHEIVAGGFSNHPVLFTESANGWKFAKNLDIPAKDILVPNASSQGEEEESAFGMSALRKFKELDLKGKVSQQEQKSTHENSITDLTPYAESNGQVTQISSVALDGKLVIYRL